MLPIRLQRATHEQTRRRAGRWLMSVVAAVAWLWLVPAPSPAEAAQPPKKTPQIDLRPVEVGGNELITRDGVQLTATFYPGAKGKKSVPVILLHGYKGERKEYASLAAYLQWQGCAVLVPDLRGHGASTRALAGVELEAGKHPAGRLFSQMVYEDMETLRDFLLRKNNEGGLNISKLCVVGSEMGALAALHWARYDWFSLTGERPPMHVKALVLISPPLNFHGIDAFTPLRHPPVRSQLSLLILVGGRKGAEFEDAERIYRFVKPYHTDPPEDEAMAKQDLFCLAMPTTVQGTKMLGVKELQVERVIAHFIALRLIGQDRAEYAWRERNLKEP